MPRCDDRRNRGGYEGHGGTIPLISIHRKVPRAVVTTDKDAHRLRGRDERWFSSVLPSGKLVASDGRFWASDRLRLWRTAFGQTIAAGNAFGQTMV